MMEQTGILVNGMYVGSSTRTSQKSGEVSEFFTVAFSGGAVEIKRCPEYPALPPNLDIGSELAVYVRLNCFNNRIYFMQSGPVVFPK